MSIALSVSFSGFDCTSGYGFDSSTTSGFVCSCGNGERHTDCDDEQHAENLSVDHLGVEKSMKIISC